MAAGLAGIVLVVAAVYYRRQARKWRLFKLADIDQMGGIEFEHYLVKLLRALKYQQVSVTQGQGDFGVDILYQKDGLKYAAQVKRKRGLVGVDALYQAVGGRDFYHADVAVVITNSQFSPAAYKFARQSKVELVDRSKLAEWVVAAQQLG
jgi:restriction system protein